jgi:hypothetical protein
MIGIDAINYRLGFAIIVPVHGRSALVRKGIAIVQDKARALSAPAQMIALMCNQWSRPGCPERQKIQQNHLLRNVIGA